jgi:hypothetical protein
MFHLPKKLSTTIPTAGQFSHIVFHSVDLECGAVVITSKLVCAGIIVKQGDFVSKFGFAREEDFPRERICS